MSFAPYRIQAVVHGMHDLIGDTAVHLDYVPAEGDPLVAALLARARELRAIADQTMIAAGPAEVGGVM